MIHSVFFLYLDGWQFHCYDSHRWVLFQSKLIVQPHEGNVRFTSQQQVGPGSSSDVGTECRHRQQQVSGHFHQVQSREIIPQTNIRGLKKEPQHRMRETNNFCSICSCCKPMTTLLTKVFNSANAKYEFPRHHRLETGRPCDLWHTEPFFSQQWRYMWNVSLLA